MYRQSDFEIRVLILAPTGRDAALLSKTLALTDIPTEICTSSSNLLDSLSCGAAAVLVAEEAVSPTDVNQIGAWLMSQPPWSDIPFIVLTSTGRSSHATSLKALELQGLGNVTFLERPVRPETIEAAVHTALRARRRQYEIRLRQETLTLAYADLEQFAYAASHDLQEPIRNMAIYSDLLIREYHGQLDEKGLTFLRYVQDGAERMEKLVADLLAYTKAATIADEIPEPVGSGKPLQGALLNLADAIRQNEVEVTYGPLPAVRIREIHLQQLFQNLISNAIKYRSARKLKISITAAQDDGQWLWGVHDNGIGIKPEYHKRVFGLFKRLHGSDEYSGTGIGLAICQRIVERYRGRIWVDSKPEQGSSFFFTLPA